MSQGSKKDGLRDGEEGREDPFRYASDKGYREGVDAGKGIRKGEEAEKELREHPVTGPIIDALGGYGLDSMGLSKEGQRTYDRIRHGDTPARVFGDELSGVDAEDEDTSSGSYIDSCHDDRHYTTRDSSSSTSSGSKRSSLVSRVVVFMILGLGALGYLNYRHEKQILEPKFQVAKRYQIPQNTLVDRLRWHGFRHSKRDAELDANLALSRLRPPPNLGLRDDLKGLAKILNGKGERQVRFYDWARTGNEIWIGGSYYQNSGGILCYSPDAGKTWFKQWASDPVESASYPNNVPQRIAFWGRDNGYFLTGSRVFHTDNAGREWKSIYSESYSLIKQFQFLDKDRVSLTLIKYGNKSDFPGRTGIEYSPGMIYFEYSKTVTNQDWGQTIVFENPLGSNANR